MAGRCVYTYFGGSFVEIPHEEGAAKHWMKQPCPRLLLAALRGGAGKTT